MVDQPCRAMRVSCKNNLIIFMIRNSLRTNAPRARSWVDWDRSRRLDGGCGLGFECDCRGLVQLGVHLQAVGEPPLEVAGPIRLDSGRTRNRQGKPVHARRFARCAHFSPQPVFEIFPRRCREESRRRGWREWSPGGSRDQVVVAFGGQALDAFVHGDVEAAVAVGQVARMELAGAD